MGPNFFGGGGDGKTKHLQYNILDQNKQKSNWFYDN